MAYMDAKQFNQIAQFEKIKLSKAVKLFLNRAAHGKQLADHYQQLNKNLQDDQVIPQAISEADEYRIENVWMAITVGQFERGLGWPLIENQEVFIRKLITKYNSNLDLASDQEHDIVNFIELLEVARKHQAAGDWR